MQAPQRNKLLKALAFLAAGGAAVVGGNLFKRTSPEAPPQITRSEEKRISAQDAAKVKLLNDSIAKWDQALSVIEEHLFKRDPAAIQRKDLTDILISAASLKTAVLHALGGYDWVSQSRQNDLIGLRTRTENVIREAAKRLNK